MKPIEEMDIRENIVVPGMSGNRYLTEAIFNGGDLDKLLIRYNFLEPDDVLDFLKVSCDTRLDGIMVVPIGKYTPEALAAIKRYEPKIQLYRTGLEGKSC